MASKSDNPLRLFLIDGSAYIFRAYHALPPLTRKSDGAPIGAVSGFSNMLYKLLTDMKDDHNPTHLAVIFDHSSKTFRNDLYPEYKANREAPPEDLRPQFAMVRDATRAFNLPSIEMAGYEADDLIATYARQAEAAGGEAVIISSDKDLMQLVSDKISMFDTMKNKIIKRDEVIEKFGMPPESVIDVQSLAGDSTDNVPGVPGIGVKTAALLLSEYGDLDTLLERAGEIKQKKRRENLIEFADQARISRDLVTLKTDVPINETIDEFIMRPIDPDLLMPFLQEMEFTTLTRRVASDLAIDEPTAPVVESTPTEVAYETVLNVDALQQWVDKAYQRGFIAVDTETDGLNTQQANLVGVCLSTKAGEGCYIPLGHGADGLALDDEDVTKQIPLKEAVAILKPMLEDPSILKIGQNIKFDANILARYGIEIGPFDDTMLLSYALDSGRTGHGMDTLAQTHLGIAPIKFSDIVGTGKNAKTFDQIPIREATPYAAEDADITLRLYQSLKPRLATERKTAVYETLERPLVPVIAAMERAGVKIDASVLQTLSADFEKRMSVFEAQAIDIVGEEFNIGSPKQISEILFGKLGLPGGRKTAKGAWSTKADVLEELAAEGHELPRLILNWRSLAKLKSTYTDSLPLQVNPDTGRIHTSYSLAATTTGRLASTDPNLQNIPIRTEDARKIRAAFIPEKGNVLISADYSQVELRLLAHIADIASMKQAFADGIDIHAMTASEMFGVSVKDMDPIVRRSAKAINFGIIYGISPFGLANQLAISRSEAKDYIDSYFKKFPGIRQYMDETIALVKANGYVETVFGRRIHIETINDKNPARRGYAERQAINAPIQGAAADVIRRAMINIPGTLKAKNLNAQMLLQVHDELIFEAPKKEAEETCALVSQTMRKAPEPMLTLSVPLEVEAQAGANWGEAH